MNEMAATLVASGHGLIEVKSPSQRAAEAAATSEIGATSWLMSNSRRAPRPQVRPELSPLCEDLLPREEPLVPEPFLASGVEEDLRRDGRDPVLLGAASRSFQTSRKITSSRPRYVSRSSSRMGAISLHGMHRPAPRSSSRGSRPGDVRQAGGYRAAAAGAASCPGDSGQLLVGCSAR